MGGGGVKSRDFKFCSFEVTCTLNLFANKIAINKIPLEVHLIFVHKGRLWISMKINPLGQAG